MQTYSNPARESDPHALPDVEVFYMSASDIAGASRGTCWLDENDEPLLKPGWFWWSCFPGCLPDGEPNGPFKTADEAKADAQSSSEE